MRALLPLSLVAALAVPAAAQPVVPYEGPVRVRFELDQVQAALAVQQLDGWLLSDQGGSNPVATSLINPAGAPARRWFYLIPAKGEAVVLVHRGDLAAFDDVPGRKLEYTGHKELGDGLRAMLKGHKKVAMEYAPRSGIPSLSRVDAATVELVRELKVTVDSSAQLVQLTKALWGPQGRIAHYVAAHHLGKLRDDALALVTQKVTAGEKITELEVQQRIIAGMKMRGLSGPPPVVAVNDHAADPSYAVTADKAREIRKGDLLLLSLAGAADDLHRPIFAELTWVAYVGDTVPERYVTVFDQLVAA
ncbi:MAG TPA: M24 family metallopeptidase, partial [Kofleriaceae bacterium]|nr:M24 family metallopeptidase [Kofleriaceae bacterium]